MDTRYLTESILEEKLLSLYGVEFIHNRKFIDKYRPDFRNVELKLIVEFDGFYHYTTMSRIISDEIKDSLYYQNGYKTVHIPYFIQLKESTIKEAFGDIEIKCDISDVITSFPHGFIDKKCILPCDFNQEGTIRFLKDLERFPSAKDDIIQSLYDRIKSCGDWRCVINDKIRRELAFKV